MDYQNQGNFEEFVLHQNTATKTTDEREHSIDAVILSHPDYHRRLQNHTGSADLCFIPKNTGIMTNRALAGCIK
ncbi:hypothetical protein AAY47_02305 [Xenorhabdus griffiniae]|nr:hypothetical protein AAY47_02305 [Xenorhabdus griffiniae]